MPAGHHTEDITSLLTALQAIDIGSLGDDDLAERCLAVATLLDVVQAHAAELTAEFDVRGAWAVDGASSGAAWLAARCQVRKGDLAGLANVGKAMRRLPAVTAAVKNGEIGFDHVRRIKDCARKDPGLDGDAEAFLLEQARVFGPDTFRMVAREWRSKAEDTADDGEAPVEEPGRREFVHLSQTFDGWWRLDGELGPDNGATVAAFLDEHVDKALRAQR